MFVKCLDLPCSLVEAPHKSFVYAALGLIYFLLCDFQRFDGKFGSIEPVNVANQGLVFVPVNICKNLFYCLGVLCLEGKTPFHNGIQPLLRGR